MRAWGHKYASDACKLTISSYLFARWHLFRHVGYLRHQHLLTLKVVSESRVMRATSVPILVFLGLSVLELGQMYATDRQSRQTDVRQKHRLMRPPYGGGGITKGNAGSFSVSSRSTSNHARRQRARLTPDVDWCTARCG